MTRKKSSRNELRYNEKQEERRGTIRRAREQISRAFIPAFAYVQTLVEMYRT